MGRNLPELGQAVVAEIEEAWVQPQEEWARRRLLVVRLIAQHELTVAQIMRVADVSRQTVFTYRDKVVAGGVAGLLQRGHGGGPVPTVRGRGRRADRAVGGRPVPAGERRAGLDQKTHPQKPDRERGAPAVAPDRREAKGAAQIARQKGSGQGRSVQARVAHASDGSGGPCARSARAAVGAR